MSVTTGRTAWKKQLTVDRRIVRLLSASTYDDFPGAIREMVSNAYDADATEVNITIDLKNDLIEVTDNGNGMTPEEFDFFLRIAGQQRGKRTSPEFGRQRIGQFGIGFLATFPFGKRMQVVSSARRSDVRFEAIVPTERFMQEGQRLVDVEDIPIQGYEVRGPRLLEEHGTTIRMIGLTDMVSGYFQARNIVIRGSRSTVRAWEPLARLEWSLSEDLPLAYPSESPYREAFSDLGPSGITVRLNGKELFRNSPGSHILENKAWESNGISCRYVIATDWKSINPSENRYLKQRLRNVGIGTRTSFGLGLEGRAYSRLHWLTGEIRILDGFDNLLSIDRAKFIDSPEYDQFREYFRSRLGYFANHVETISEAQRDIKRQFSDSRAAEVGARRDVVGRNVEKLASRGFKVVSKREDQSSRKASPVSIDIERKVVEIVEDHQAFLDTISVGSEKIPVRYKAWEWEAAKEKFPAVRWANDGAIEINTSYPLFESRRYGEVFKKVLVIILTLAEKSNSPQDLVSRVARQLPEEFSGLS
ncbi:MAG TPA: ATP-binding protein [Anaerolineae bacterium]|nr:ATP-binding protein [Anaerolineae bacterium]